MSFKNLLAFGIPLVSIFGIVGFRYVQKTGDDAKLKQQQAARAKAPMVVKFAVAGPAQISDSIDLVGTLESPYVNRLSSKTAGRIVRLDVREGTKVTPGQVLVQLDPAEINGQILAAKSALAEAESRLSQARMTQASTGVGITRQIRKDKAGLSSSAADTAQVRQNVAAQIAAAEASVADAKSKKAAADAQVISANADLQTAKANQANAKTKYDRLSSLYKDGFVAPQDVDDAKTVLDVQLAAVTAAQSKVDAARASAASTDAIVSSAENQLSITRNKVQADVAAADARLAQARATLDVSASNSSQIAAYQANIQALSAAVAAARGQLDQARSRLADTSLASSIEGTVTQRSADPGTIVSAGQTVVVAQYLKWLFVSMQVPVESATTVKVGASYGFKVDGLDQSFTGVVSDISGAADPVSRQVLVRLKVQNPDLVLRPGTFAHVSLRLSQTNAEIAVPAESLQGQSGQKSVIVMDKDGKAKTVPVTVGAMGNGLVEVKSGLSPGDRVVILSTRAPKDGQALADGDAATKSKKESKP